MNTKIFVALSTFAKQGETPLNLLRESNVSFSVNPLGKRLSQEELLELGGECEGVIAGLEPYNDYVLDRMSHLRCISRCGVGIDNISIEKAKARGIIIQNTPDVVIQPVAELTVAFIFDLLKKLTQHTQLLKSQRWERKTGGLLQGKKVGVLGLGRIGKRVAELLKNLGADIYGTDITPDVEWAEETDVKIVTCDELLCVSDILTIHLAQAAQKPFQLGEREIAKMKEGAMVVNVSRGCFVDEAALYQALKSEKLSAAALDVYAQEPYTGPLCSLDNVILTPHIATLTRESRLQMEIAATKNLLNVLSRDYSVK